MKYEKVQERGLYLKISKKTLGHYMFYLGIMGGGLLDSVVLIIKIQDVAVQIMSSIGWANNSQEKICAGSFLVNKR